MKKIRKSMIVLGIVCLFFAYCSMSPMDIIIDASRDVQTDSSHSIEKIYSVITSDDEFCYNSIIVVMDDVHSGSFINSNCSFRLESFYDMFNDIGASSIIDMAAIPDSIHYENGTYEINLSVLE